MIFLESDADHVDDADHADHVGNADNASCRAGRGARSQRDCMSLFLLLPLSSPLGTTMARLESEAS